MDSVFCVRQREEVISNVPAAYDRFDFEAGASSAVPALPHSPFGGSGAARILACPASVGLAAKVPNHSQQPSAFAIRGIALHAAMTLLIKNARPLNASLGYNINNYVITRPDLVSALLPTYAYVKQLLAS